jgi:hypothetical protein
VIVKLAEGGNVFKDSQGQPRTQRINLADIVPTVRWLEGVTTLELENNMLGSTGLKPTSGDLDLAVDSNAVDKNTFAEQLGQWVRDQGQDPRDWVKRSGTAVHFLTPIAGDPRRGYVQTDFMFVPKPGYSKFMMRADPESAYKGVTRNVMLSSIAKAQGYKINATHGLIDRASERVISDDPAAIARRLLHPQAAAEDLASVERIVRALANDPRREEKLRDFRDYAAREGIPFDEHVQENDVSFIARLRDRIVNQGMQALVETQQVTESTAEPGVGGRAKGIEHLEDLVFRRAGAGVEQALAILGHAADSPATTTVKWDGKPAVIFGRKPATGEFVLTDGSGFEARGYDGLATSPDMMARIQRQRSGDREGLIALYSKLFPLLEQATPGNFRGYVKGDLLYTSTPPVQAGNYVFQPNTVQYRIPVRSGLGQRIGDSDVGIAMHTMYADQGDSAQPLSRVKFNTVPGLLLIEPIRAQSVEVDPAQVKKIRQVARQHGAAIDTLFNPAELRQQQLTDLARLCVDYINHRIGTGNFDDLLSGFLEWLPARVTPRKLKNITEYLRSPSSNMDGLIAAFTLFLLLHDLKMSVLEQLDQQSPGNEGWVMSTPAGYAKAVNRFDFTVRNRARNNP